MIAIDPTETTPRSRCPTIPGALIYPTLEADTGADIIISPLNMPVTTVLLQRHLDAGALLVQRKSGADLPASIIDNRFYTSLAKMRMLGVRQFQCVLLTTGYYWPGRKGKLDIVTPVFHANRASTINREYYPHISYQAITSALESWTWLGGVCLPSLTCDAEIPAWVINTHRRLKQKFNQGAYREIWPAPPELYDPPASNDPLQEPILVTGWRALLAAFKGVGPSRVNALKAELIENKMDLTFIQALMWIASDSNKIPGWGPKIRQSVTDQLGGPGTWARLAELRNNSKEPK